MSTVLSFHIHCRICIALSKEQIALRTSVVPGVNEEVTDIMAILCLSLCYDSFKFVTIVIYSTV